MEGLFVVFGFVILHFTGVIPSRTIIKANQFLIIKSNTSSFEEKSTMYGFKEKTGNTNDISSKPIKVAIYPDPPYTMYDIEDNESKPYGMILEVFELIAEISRLKYEYIRIPEKDFAYGVLKNGSWNGVVRMLADKDVNMTLVLLGMNKNRKTAINYSSYLITILQSVAIRNPILHGWNEFEFFTYFGSFSSHVWLATLVAVILFHIVAWAGKRANEGTINGKNIQKKNKYQEINEASSHWIGERISFISFNIMIILLTSMYLSKLTSVLIVKIFPFEGIEDVMMSGYLIGTIKDSFQEELFKTSRNGLYSKIGKAIEKDPKNLVASVSDAMQRIQKEKYAFIYGQPELEAILEENCEIVLLKEKYVPLKVYLGFQKVFFYAEIINKYLRIFMENGILYRLKEKYFSSSQLSCVDNQNYESIHLNKVIGAFIVLLMGLFLSLLTLNLELLYSKCFAKL